VKSCYVAIDLGASSGRVMAGTIKVPSPFLEASSGFTLDEIYRFRNGIEKTDGRDGTLVWNHMALFNNIVEGMSRCTKKGFKPVSAAIDTWGVDFVLLDKDDNVIGNAVSYRDTRTDGIPEIVGKIIPDVELYRRTGINIQPYNTIYQLMALKKNNPEMLRQAKTMLMTPDYFGFLLTGIKETEYTIASTTGLLKVNADKAGRDVNVPEWDFELIEKLGLPSEIFTKIALPGSILSAHLKRDIIKKVGYDCRVVHAASHDTASAVLSVKAMEKDFYYISSGTWSLPGILIDHPVLTDEAMKAGLTNEGGFGGKITLLKNTMGMWIVNRLREEESTKYTFGQLYEMAEKFEREYCSKEYIFSKNSFYIDVNDPVFMAPKSMKNAIEGKLGMTGMDMPALIFTVYKSLAMSYAQTKAELEKICGKHFDRIYIVGGGSKAGYLNGLTQRAASSEVVAGETEATAIGNFMAQKMTDNIS
jgi:rhamnulokinase